MRFVETEVGSLVEVRLPEALYSPVATRRPWWSCFASTCGAWGLTVSVRRPDRS